MLRLLLLGVCIVYLLASPRPAAADDDLLALLSGEFALQEGRYAEAARAYVAAAENSAAVELSERAARVALLAKDAELAERALARWTTLAPDALAVRQMAAVLALRRGDVDLATRELTTLLKAEGDDNWKLALQALAGERAGAAAGAALERLIAADAIPPGIDATMGFGGLAQALDRDAAAATLAERLAERHPMRPQPWLWRAEIAHRRGEDEAALAAIQRALALPDLDTGMRLGAAAMLNELGRPADAAQALAQGEQEDATLAARAAYLARAEDSAALAALYAEVLGEEAQPRSPERLMLLGQLAELREAFADARDWYQRLLDRDDIDDGLRGQAQLRRAVALERGGDLDAALASLHAYQDSGGEHGESLVGAHLLEAELLIRNRRHEDALAAYDRGLSTFEDDPDLLYGRALGLERLDRVDEAIATLRRLLELDPDNADVMNALGYTLADRTDQLDEARELIEQALAQRPDNAAILDSMGWVLFRQGQAQEALTHLRRAFELQRDAEIAAHLGEVLWRLGETDEARSIWRLGEELDADNRALKSTIERYLP